jgi:hypothetical protein
LKITRKIECTEKMDKPKHEELPYTSPDIPSSQVQQPHLQPNMSPDVMDPPKMETTQSSCESRPLVKTEDHLDSPAAKSIGRFIFEA